MYLCGQKCGVLALQHCAQLKFVKGLKKKTTKPELINSYYWLFQLKFDFQILALIFKLCFWRLQISFSISPLIRPGWTRANSRTMTLIIQQPEMYLKLFIRVHFIFIVVM